MFSLPGAKEQRITEKDTRNQEPQDGNQKSRDKEARTKEDDFEGNPYEGHCGSFAKEANSDEGHCRQVNRKEDRYHDQVDGEAVPKEEGRNCQGQYRRKANGQSSSQAEAFAQGEGYSQTRRQEVSSQENGW